MTTGQISLTEAETSIVKTEQYLYNPKDIYIYTYIHIFFFPRRTGPIIIYVKMAIFVYELYS